MVSVLLIAAVAFSQESTIAVSRMPLPAGKELTFDDLLTVSLPDAWIPPTAVRRGADLVGRTLSLPIAGRSPIVAERLVGHVASPTAASTVRRSLGPTAPLVQAGDRVAFVRTGPAPCRVLWATVTDPADPATLSAPAEALAGLTERDVPLWAGASPPPLSLPPCEGP